MSAGLRRRKLLGAAALGLLSGCAAPGGGGPAVRIVALAGGRELTRAALLAEALRCDYLLLGEQHDNPHHHAERGAWLGALPVGTPVVAEQLTRGMSVPAQGEALLARLQAGGFDPKGWRWPLHEPLFAAAAGPGRLLLGGNVPRELAREVARRGPAAWPPELAALLEAAALDAAAQAALDEDLLRGHCGMLGQERVASMRAAQRLRDASMWLALRDAHAAAPGLPAVLLAGNGHVRSDYGVPTLIRRHAPQARWMSVGFVEPGFVVDGAVPYTHLCITAGVPEREDPCKNLKLPLAPARP